ncbi:MAG: metallophosphoesterase, partial [Bryobacteraceae bacterium]
MIRLTLVCVLLCLSPGYAGEPPFVVEPYLQMGDAPKLSSSDSMAILWHTADVDQPWDVQVKKPESKKWSGPIAAVSTRVAVRGIEPHRMFRVRVKNLKEGEEFDYRVLRDGAAVFEARARARKSKNQPYRFAVFGDCGAGTPESREIAFQAYRAKPDFVFLTGDIV